MIMPGLPEAPRPGCVPLRPLGLGDILDGSFKVIRRNPKVTLGLSAAIAVLQVLFVAIFEVLAFARLGNVRVTTADPTAQTRSARCSASSAAVGGHRGQHAARRDPHRHAHHRGHAGRAGHLAHDGQVWERTRGRIWRLIGLAVLTTVLQFLGLVLCLRRGSGCGASGRCRCRR